MSPGNGSESVEPQRALERQAADLPDPGIALVIPELVDAQALVTRVR